MGRRQGRGEEASRWIGRLAVRNDRAALRAVRELVALGAHGLRVLRQIAGDCDRPVVLRWVMDGLGAFHSRSATAILLRGLRSPHMTVRLHALASADRRGAPTLVRAIRPLLRDESGGVRINALAILIRRQVKGLGRILEAATRDPKPYVRALATKTLDSLSRDGDSRPR